MSGTVYILGSAMIKFSKYMDRNIKSLTGEALDLVLKDCGLPLDDIQAAWFSNSGWGIHTFQHCIRGQVALSANGLEGIPITNVENACASGSTALHGAWTAVKAGLYDCVLAMGAEKLYSDDRAKTMQGFLGGMDVEVVMDQMGKFAEEERKRKEKEAKEKGIEPPPEKPGGHSVFMDWYAIGARRHMDKYGTTQRQLAAIAAKNHNNSTLNELAQYTFADRGAGPRGPRGFLAPDEGDVRAHRGRGGGSHCLQRELLEEASLRPGREGPGLRPAVRQPPGTDRCVGTVGQERL